MAKSRSELTTYQGDKVKVGELVLFGMFGDRGMLVGGTEQDAMVAQIKTKDGVLVGFREPVSVKSSFRKYHGDWKPTAEEQTVITAMRAEVVKPKGKSKPKAAAPKQEVKLVSPAADLQWSEPKDKLERIAAEFRKYYGKKVTIYGGGGAPPSTAVLQRVELHPTILKGKDGYTLKAYVKGADSKILPTDKGGDWDFWLGSWQIAVNSKLAGKVKPEGLPSGLTVKKVKGGYEVIHTKSGNSLMPFAYPEKELATDFARRAGQVGVDWTRPFPELQKESEKIADLIRGGKTPGMFEKVLDMPTTFPSGKESELMEQEAELGWQSLQKGKGALREGPTEKGKQLLSDATRLKREAEAIRDKRMSGSSATNLQSVHDSRSTRSRESDERQSNADTIEPDDPRVEQWVKDQGRMDVVNIDTPRKHKGKKVARKTRKSTRTGTQVRGIR